MCLFHECASQTRRSRVARASLIFWTVSFPFLAIGLLLGRHGSPDVYDFARGLTVGMSLVFGITAVVLLCARRRNGSWPSSPVA